MLYFAPHGFEIDKPPPSFLATSARYMNTAALSLAMIALPTDRCFLIDGNEVFAGHKLCVNDPDRLK